MNDLISMTLKLIGAVCVILLTYFASRWYAKKSGAAGLGKHIKIVDRLVVSKTGSVLIIDVDGTRYLIGVNEQNIQILKELETNESVYK